MTKRIASSILLLIASMHAAADESVLKTNEAQASYSLGMILGSRIQEKYSDVIDLKVMMEGLKSTYEKDGKPSFTMEEAESILSEAESRSSDDRLERAKSAGKTYLANNAKRAGVVVTESGLQYEVVKPSDGQQPMSADTVLVYFQGTTLEGSVVESADKEDGKPAELKMTDLVEGLQEGLRLMGVGSKYNFAFSSDLGFGDFGSVPVVGPGQALLYEVELVGINSK